MSLGKARRQQSRYNTFPGCDLLGKGEGGENGIDFRPVAVKLARLKIQNLINRMRVMPPAVCEI